MFLKKYGYLLLTTVALVCGAFGLSACGQEHEHVWGDWEVTSPATCMAEGSQHRFCTECNEEEIQPLAKTDHTYSAEWEVVVPASCTAEGSERNKCTVCQTEQTRVIQKLSHTEVPVAKVDATCLTPGREAGTECSICGTPLSGLEKIPALGHSFGDWANVKQSTCTDQGLDQRTCTRDGCGAVEDRVLGFKPHQIESFGTNKEATCTEPGSKAGERCSVCEHVIRDEETVPALGHSMQSPQYYEKDGEDYHKGSCSRCGVSDVDEPCTFTVVVTAATCTEAEHHVHTCPTCGHKYEHDEGDPLGHNFGDWHFDVEAYDRSLRDADGAETVVRQHRRVCSNPGHTPDPAYPEVEACSKEQAEAPVEATCTMSGYTKFRCADCENTYTGDRKAALGHEWEKNADGTVKYTHVTYQGMEVHYRTCTRANCDRPDGRDTYYACYYTSATREKATCTKGATIVRVCDYCKYRAEEETGEPLGHSYGVWLHNDDTSGEESAHYRVCARTECGNVDREPCTMKSSDKLPTCRYEGQAIQVCEKCRYTEEGDALPKLQHDVTGQPYVTERASAQHYQACKLCGERVYEDCPYTTSVKAMTCTTDEETTYSCPTCGDTFTRVTARTKGHTVTQYTDSDKFYHRGRCDGCGETVSVLHDFSECNICSVCGTDGLTYAFEAGSDNTRAKVVRSIKDGAVFNIDTPKLVIPATVDFDGHGKVPVVGITSDAFYGNRSLKEMELPLSLEYIGYHTFQGCTELADVYFTGHAPGEQNVANCKLNRIEAAAFKDCVSLTNAILPETLQYIGQEAFRGCTKLAEIEIPAQVTEIEDHAFMDTAYFNDPLKWTGDVLYIGPHLIRAKTSLSGAYEVQAGVISVSAEAFKDCVYLTKITLPATITAVDRDAFAGCTALDTVVFRGTFAQYLGIRFDNNAASPMHCAKTLTIEGAQGTPSIPAGTTVIPAGAFKGSDITGIVIPASVTSIGAGAFENCAQLSSITFEKGSKLLTVGADLVKGTQYFATEENWDGGALYLKDEEGKPVVLVAADEAKLAAYVPYEDESFSGSAKQLTIADGTLVVAPAVFAGFTSLRCVTVPGTVIYFGEGVFDGCTGLDRVNFRGAGLKWFCYSASIGRVYDDSYVYGGANGDAYDIQWRAATMFKVTYPLQWKRGNF